MLYVIGIIGGFCLGFLFALLRFIKLIEYKANNKEHLQVNNKMYIIKRKD